MPTRQERLNYVIARAHVESPNGRLPMKGKDGETLVTCVFCDGTGLPADTNFRHVEYCKTCNGKGYIAVAKPKTVKCEYGLGYKKENNGTRS